MVRLRSGWILAVLALLVLFIGVGVLLGPQAIPRAVAFGTVTGVVFRDYNADGVRGPYEPGVANVTVTAYDSTGSDVGTNTSGADGAYSLDWTGNDTQVRLEFSNLPAGFLPGPFGVGSGTAVQFVSAGGTADLGINQPHEYCQNNPELVTSCYVFGAQTGNRPVFISFPYESGTTSQDDNANVTNPATHDLAIIDTELGTVWGTAYQRESRSIFAAAFTKRHTGYGPGGLGAIYRIDRASGAVSPFLDFAALFPGSVGADPHAPGDFFNDTSAWDGVGKTAFGDIEISEDEQTLFIVALGDRKLYRVPIGTPPTPPALADIVAYTLPTPADCPTPDINLRPGGLGRFNGQIYVGLTCTGESTGSTADLRAYVYQFDPATSVFTPIVNLPLTYPRGCVSRSSSFCANAEWRPWVSTVTLFNGPFGQRVNPQPWLTDIEFDEGGFMILGIMDRFGHQSGNDNASDGAAGTVGPIEGVSAGDILRLEPTGGAWQIEQNGTVGGVTGQAGNNQGPGGGEFYWHDRFWVSVEDPTHDEITLGGCWSCRGVAR